MNWKRDVGQKRLDRSRRRRSVTMLLMKNYYIGLQLWIHSKRTHAHKTRTFYLYTPKLYWTANLLNKTMGIRQIVSATTAVMVVAIATIFISFMFNHIHAEKNEENFQSHFVCGGKLRKNCILFVCYSNYFGSWRVSFESDGGMRWRINVVLTNTNVNGLNTPIISY